MYRIQLIGEYSLIVSIPVDLSPDPELAKLEEKGVHGRYVSIERLTELENGKVEWRMATSSKAGGLLPQSLTEMSVPSNIAHVRLLRVCRVAFGWSLMLIECRTYLDS